MRTRESNAMNHYPVPSRLPSKLSLGMAFIVVLSQSLHAGPNAGQNTQLPRPAPAQVQGSTKSPGAGPLTATQASPTKSPVVNYGVFVPGKKVFSSGMADVNVQVLNPATVSPVPREHPKPDLSPYNRGLYLLSPGPERFIASNKDAGKVINLGKLPPGELVFAIRPIDRNDYFRTGDPKQNPDGLVHAEVRTFGSDSPVEIWFEDAFGKKGTDRSDRDFNDLVVSVSGGIDNGDMSNLAQAIQQQPAANRDALISELKKADPKTAAALGSSVPPAAK